MGTITTGLSNAFKLELLKGNHDFDSDTMRVALIKENPSANYGPTTVSYSELGSDQASGSGYTSVYNTLTTGATAALSTTDASGNSTTYPQNCACDHCVPSSGSGTYLAILAQTLPVDVTGWLACILAASLAYRPRSNERSCLRLALFLCALVIF